MHGRKFHISIYVHMYAYSYANDYCICRREILQMLRLLVLHLFCNLENLHCEVPDTTHLSTSVRATEVIACTPCML